MINKSAANSSTLITASESTNFGLLLSASLIGRSEIIISADNFRYHFNVGTSTNKCISYSSCWMWWWTEVVITTRQQANSRTTGNFEESKPAGLIKSWFLVGDSRDRIRLQDDVTSVQLRNVSVLSLTKTDKTDAPGIEPRPVPPESTCYSASRPQRSSTQKTLKHRGCTTVWSFTNSEHVIEVLPIEYFSVIRERCLHILEDWLQVGDHTFLLHLLQSLQLHQRRLQQSFVAHSGRSVFPSKKLPGRLQTHHLKHDSEVAHNIQYYEIFENAVLIIKE